MKLIASGAAPALPLAEAFAIRLGETTTAAVAVAVAPLASVTVRLAPQLPAAV